MRKLINITIIFILSFTSANSTRVAKVCGYLDDVSPNERWILYRTPHDCMEDEASEGNLSVMDVETNKVITIATDVTIEDPISLFVDNSTIARPTQGKVVCYNIEQKEVTKDLFIFGEELEFLEFSLNQAKTHAALLLKDAQGGEMFLQVINLADFEKHEIIHKLPCFEQCSDAVTGPICWYGNHIVYSLQNQLYDYQIGELQSLLISENVYDYALNGDELVFIEWDKVYTYKFKKFLFSSVGIEDFTLQPPIEMRDVKFIELNMASIGHVYQASLNINQEKFYMIEKDGKLTTQANPILYKTSRLSIQKELTTSISSYDRVTRVIDRAQLIIEKLGN
ncbi:hypothetical protein Aasi_0167 [Candidatus Amoebophilus asiaticus 5a2]|uniref:Uncharacterized protein n=1 Tax=Amoebophilus asiaticus (strain 5a2) TaxID=452471 RepID=B3EUJ3_AMOA5|nr:hypothetical protein [Candidatus Amoebophilus asiaticus]ACE05612.1 hypothetical protein Aasi_0167 [Candidatus Amoebophilus asiaticus 5a2]